MQNIRIQISPLQLSYSSKKQLSISLKQKRFLISTNYEIQKFDRNKQYPLKNNYINLAPFSNDLMYSFNISKQFQLSNTKVQIMIFGLLNKDINLLGIATIDLGLYGANHSAGEAFKIKNELKLSLDKCDDPRAYLTVAINIQNIKKINIGNNKPLKSNSDGFNSLKTESYNKQSLLIGRRKNPDIPTAYQISRKNYKQTEVVRITQQKQKSVQRNRQNSGSYKKRFEYQYQFSRSVTRQQQQPQIVANKQPQAKTYKIGQKQRKKQVQKGSPMPRIKTPQPILDYNFSSSFQGSKDNRSLSKNSKNEERRGRNANSDASINVNVGQERNWNGLAKDKGSKSFSYNQHYDTRNMRNNEYNPRHLQLEQESEEDKDYLYHEGQMNRNKYNQTRQKRKQNGEMPKSKVKIIIDVQNQKKYTNNQNKNSKKSTRVEYIETDGDRQFGRKSRNIQIQQQSSQPQEQQFDKQGIVDNNIRPNMYLNQNRKIDRNSKSPNNKTGRISQQNINQSPINNSNSYNYKAGKDGQKQKQNRYNSDGSGSIKPNKRGYGSYNNNQNFHKNTSMQQQFGQKQYNQQHQSYNGYQQHNYTMQPQPTRPKQNIQTDINRQNIGKDKNNGTNYISNSRKYKPNKYQEYRHARSYENDKQQNDDSVNNSSRLQRNQDNQYQDKNYKRSPDNFREEPGAAQSQHKSKQSRKNTTKKRQQINPKKESSQRSREPEDKYKQMVNKFQMIRRKLSEQKKSSSASPSLEKDKSPPKTKQDIRNLPRTQNGWGGESRRIKSASQKQQESYYQDQQQPRIPHSPFKQISPNNPPTLPKQGGNNPILINQNKKKDLQNSANTFKQHNQSQVQGYSPDSTINYNVNQSDKYDGKHINSFQPHFHSYLGTSTDNFKDDQPTKIMNKHFSQKQQPKRQQQPSKQQIKNKQQKIKQQKLKQKSYNSFDISSNNKSLQEKSVGQFSVSQKQQIRSNNQNLLKPNKIEEKKQQQKQQMIQSLFGPKPKGKQSSQINNNQVTSLNRTIQQNNSYKQKDKQIKTINLKQKQKGKEAEKNNIDNLLKTIKQQKINKNKLNLSQYQLKIVPQGKNQSKQLKKSQNNNPDEQKKQPVPIADPKVVHKKCDQKIAHLQNTIDHQQQEYRKKLLQKQLQHKNSMRQQEKRRKQIYDQEMQLLKDQNSQLKQKLKNKDNQSNKSGQSMNATSPELKRLKDQNMRLRSLNQKLEQQLQKSDTQHFEQLTKNQKKDQQYQSKIQAFIRKNTQLSEQLLRKQQQLKQYTQKLTRATKNTQQIPPQSQSSQSIKQSQKQKDSKKSYEEQYLTEKKKNVNLQGQVRVKDNQIRFLKIKNQNLTQEKKDLENQIDNIAANNKLEMARQGSISKMNLQASALTNTVKLENKALKQQINSLQRQVRELNSLLQGIIVEGNFSNQRMSESREQADRQNSENMNRKYDALQRKTQAYQQQIKNKQMKIAEIINAIFSHGNPKLIDEIQKLMGMGAKSK